MEKLIKNEWFLDPRTPCRTARILKKDVHPEGLDIKRIRFVETGRFFPQADVGHFISLVRGGARLSLSRNGFHPLHLERGVHLYLPPGMEALLEAEAGAEFVCVSSASAVQARGEKLLVRDETFLSACTSQNRLLRWMITPQYLSRRIFLHHDLTLVSKSGHPVSWFHTTMFDVGGLPDNEEGEPVFKMSYNSKTEVNVCYEVKGSARVRMAQHPYSNKGQAWGPWLSLDDDSTYHLNETDNDRKEDFSDCRSGRKDEFLRNKHEVYIMGGYVSLFCMFDPAPVGMECHRPGEYSDYEPLFRVLGTKGYKTYCQEIVRFDEMVDQLSLAKAKGELGDFRSAPVWELYQQGREAQMTAEAQLVKALAAQGKGREMILARWLQTAGGLHRHSTRFAGRPAVHSGPPSPSPASMPNV